MHPEADPITKQPTMFKKIFKKWFSLETRIRYASLYINYIRNTRHSSYPRIGKNVELYGPLTLNPHNITLEDNVRLNPGLRVISDKGQVIIKKFTGVGPECLIVPGNHTPTVGLPHIASNLYINDTYSTITIGEDCWIGARCMLLEHACIGRGAVLGGGCVVTKPVPPYAVVAGNPAKIIAVRFGKEQILKHERSLYPENERMSEDEIDELFKTHFQNLRTIGTSDISKKNKDALTRLKQQREITNYAEQQ